MADESVEKDREPNESEGNRPARSFERAPFSRTSADRVTVGDMVRFDEGQVSAPDLLREECERQSQPPPSGEEIASFTASLEEAKKRVSEGTAHLFEQLAPKVKLAEQLGATIPRLPPVFDARLFESVTKAQEALRSLASAAGQFEQPQPVPMLRTTGQMTVEALASLQADMSTQQELTNTILEKLASNAEDASGQQRLWNRRYFWVGVATLACALGALIVGIISLVG